MERSIASSVQEALRVDGHSGIKVDVDGRDVTLRGSVADAAVRRSVIALAQKRRGVRVVDASALTVVNGSTASGNSNDTNGSSAASGDSADSSTASTVAVLQIRKPRIDASYKNGVLEVAGTVPTKEAAEALTFRSTLLLEPGQLVDKVVVATKATELPDMNEYRRLGDFLALLPRAGVETGTLRYDRGKLTFSAIVPEQANRTFLEREAENLVGAPQLELNLKAVDPSATTTVEPTTLPESSTTILGGAANPSVPGTGVSPSAAAAQTAVDSAVASRTIAFAKNSDALSDEGRVVVDDVAAAVAKLTDQTLVIQVVGYTDNRGSAAGNEALSQRRADAVRSELVAKGIPAARVSALGLGEVNPITPNDTEANRAKNRRIEIKVGAA